VASAKASANANLSFTFDVDSQSVFARYLLAYKTSETNYAIISDVRYIDNPELLAANTAPYPTAFSKKGLSVQMISDAQQLGVAHTVINVPINDYILTAKSSNSLQYTYAGNTYYIDRDKLTEEVYAYLVGPALEAFAKVHPEVRFERSLFGESDLAIALVPSSAVPHSTTVNTPTPVVQGEVVSRIRMSVFVPQSLDSLSSSNEKTAYYDVVYRPSAAFACTRLCRLLRQFLVK
jgi:hypothetical protein